MGRSGMPSSPRGRRQVAHLAPFNKQALKRRNKEEKKKAAANPNGGATSRRRGSAADHSNDGPGGAEDAAPGAAGAARRPGDTASGHGGGFELLYDEAVELEAERARRRAGYRRAPRASPRCVNSNFLSRRCAQLFS